MELSPPAAPYTSNWALVTPAGTTQVCALPVYVKLVVVGVTPVAVPAPTTPEMAAMLLPTSTQLARMLLVRMCPPCRSGPLSGRNRGRTLANRDRHPR